MYVLYKIIFALPVVETVRTVCTVCNACPNRNSIFGNFGSLSVHQQAHMHARFNAKIHEKCTLYAGG